MKILSFSYCFPNSANPNWGIFVFQRLSSLSEIEDLKVCSPVSWFPLLSSFKKKNGNQVQSLNGLDVYRPDFFCIPKFFKNYDAKLYAKDIKKWVSDLCKKWKPDILDAHFVWPDGVGVALIAKELGIPYVITLRGKLYECLKIDAQKDQCAKALINATAVISVSGLMAKEAQKLGVSKNRIKIIPNGINSELFFIKDKMACRKELGLPFDKKLLVTVAHLGHRKGHHEVIQALAGINEDIGLILVGGAAQGGTPEQLEKLAEKVGLSDRLIITGPQPYEKVSKYFSAADASVLASYREGCPNAVLESLGCGIPVVASDVGAVRDILPTPDAGHICLPRNTESIRTAIADVLSQEWNPKNVVKHSKVKSWKQVAEEVHEVFRDIIENME